MERNSIAEARAVRDLLIVGMVSDALRVCSALGYSANPLGAGLFIAAKFLLICGVPFLLWRSGRAHSAGLMMIAGGMVINTAYLWAFGGLHSSGLVVLVTIPIMAAFLQGVRGALVASAWSGLNLLGFAILEPHSARLIETIPGIVINVSAGTAVCVLAWWRLFASWNTTEKARGDTSSRLSALVDALEGIAWEWKDGRFSYVSGQADRLLGIPGATWLADPDFFLRQVRDVDRRLAQKFLTDTCEFRILASDGRELWLRNIPSAATEDSTYRGLLIDITARRTAESSLVEAENHLRGILDAAPDCIKLLGPDTSILAMNAAGLRMIDAESFEDVRGKRASGIVSEPYRRDFCELHRRVFEGQAGACAFEIRGLLGSVRWLESTAVPLRDAQGEIVASLSITRDMTASRQMEENLRRTHEHLTQASGIAAIGYIYNDMASPRSAEFSPEIFRIHGVPTDTSREELFLAIDAEDRARVESAISSLQREGTPVDLTYRINRPDGETRVAHVKAMAEFDKEGLPARTFGVMQDITDHYQTTERLRELSDHLESVREQERARIAREIHDELGQQLTGLKMRAAFAEHLRRTGSEALAPELACMETDLEEAIRTVRRIATQLRPPSLATHGLYAALEILTQRFETDHGIVCEFAADDTLVPTPVETAVFRVAQEALTNVAKHAGATFVSLRFHVEPGGCVLEVEDNGSGMNRSSSPGKSFGLTNMQERARMHRGELELLEGQTGGLLVRLTVPIPSQLSGKEPHNAKFSHR